MIQIKSSAPAERYYRQRRAAPDSYAYAISGVKRRIATTVFTRLRTDRNRAPLAALIADPAAPRRPIGQPYPGLAADHRTPRRAESLGTTIFASTALSGELARINDAWEAAFSGDLAL